MLLFSNSWRRIVSHSGQCRSRTTLVTDRRPAHHGTASSPPPAPPCTSTRQEEGCRGGAVTSAHQQRALLPHQSVTTQELRLRPGNLEAELKQTTKAIQQQQHSMQSFP
ncbi:hypothetical protein J4Q44_G00155650 [Coregonus suidteri]|uniref:Uncharacterized protein n=1 Tax=Coregonus suidteri TaxID=861788 RepID=A0AAN8QWG8_9TELE